MTDDDKPEAATSTMHDDADDASTQDAPAHLESRDEGAHTEYADAPASLADDETETQERQEDGAEDDDDQSRHVPDGEPDAEAH